MLSFVVKDVKEKVLYDVVEIAEIIGNIEVRNQIQRSCTEHDRP
jgi:hypothetical protein